MKSPESSAIIAKALEALFARLLQYDLATQSGLTRIGEQTLELVITDFDIQLFFVFHNGEVSVQFHAEEASTCSLNGNLANLILFLFSEALFDETPPLDESGVSVQGNPHLLTQLKNLVSQSDLDWEAPIAESFGDILGPIISQALKTTAQKIASSTKKIPPYLAEYLTEELQTLVSSNELQYFYRDVDEARAHCDRLEARISKLHPSKDTNHSQ